jgi:phosphoribosyl-AMP cyclohydrolase
VSGHVQRVIELRVDCDQDALLLRVEQEGAGACHTGRQSCFYRAVRLREPPGRTLTLDFREAEKKFDPAKVYGDGSKE